MSNLRNALNQIVSEGRKISSDENFILSDGSVVFYLERLEDIIEIATTALKLEVGEQKQ